MKTGRTVRVLAPARGAFFPATPECVTCEIEVVRVGQPIGELREGDQRRTISSAVDGFLDWLLEPGSMVAEGETVARIRVCTLRTEVPDL